MSVQDTPQELWGGETRKAVDNFPVSGERVPVAVVRWLGRVKGAAARANADLGLLDADLAQRIAAAADEIAKGKHDAQFPIDVFQTGSGTSSNMNANEVIATLAGSGTPPAHANDHVNMGQSSNDVFPSAVHLAALDEATNTLLPALERLEGAFAAKAEAFKDIVKSGRTHLMDAVPVTLGQEFAGYAAQIRLGRARVADALPRVAQIPLGGTATGTGLNTHPDFAEKVRALLSDATGLDILAPEDPFEAQGNRDALVELSGALKVIAVSLTKIANDLALMGSGPRAGIGELFLPELQKGSSIMPGKVNPVIPEVVLQVSAQVIGNDTAITIGGLQGQFELNVRIPLIARNLLQSIHLLSSTSVLFAEKCVDGIEANLEGCERSAEGTLAVATALNPFIGYDKASDIVKDASASPAARCARSRASTASTRRRSTRRWTCARSPRARRRRAERRAARAHRRVLRRRPPGGVARRGPRWPAAVRQGGAGLAVLRAPDPGRRRAEPGRHRRGARAPARPRRARGARVDPRDRARPARRRSRRAAEGQGGPADGARDRPLAHAGPARRRRGPDAAAGRPVARRDRRGAAHRLREPRHRGRRGRAGGARRLGRRPVGGRARLPVSERIRNGLTQPVVAEDASGVLAGGSHQPVGEVTAIVGVATLPSARRRGLAALVTARLVQDARERGAELVFIEAEDEDVARIYGRLGFEQVGTACIAEPL